MPTKSMRPESIQTNRLSRRELFSKASASTVAVLLSQFALPELVFPGEEDEEEHVPFLKLPRVTRKMLDWETLDSWLTPQDQVFDVHHYNEPALDAPKYRLEVAGLVDKPLMLTVNDVRKRAVAEELMTLECSGNGSSPGFMGAVYNSRWTGTPLSALLKECGVKPGATEVVFFGHDTKNETVHKVTVEVPFRAQPVDRGRKGPADSAGLRPRRSAVGATERSPSAADRSRLVRHRQRQMA